MSPVISEAIVKVDDALESLHYCGIWTPSDLACCQSCGLAEVVLETAEWEDPDMRGFAFYHLQDRDDARRDGTLYISYGSLDGTEQSIRQVAETVCDVLAHRGLRVDWDDRLTTRILVTLVHGCHGAGDTPHSVVPDALDVDGEMAGAADTSCE